MRPLIGAALTFLCLVAGSAEAAQSRTGSLRVEVFEGTTPIEGATVTAGGISAETGDDGIVMLGLTPGSFLVTAVKDGYDPASTRVAIVADGDRTVRLTVSPKPRGRDQAMTIGRAEIEDRMLMAPGSLAGVLDGAASLRAQTTSPELGLTTIRMRGLPGQYTRLLSDGVPLYFDLPGGLAPVTIPLLDLDRIDVVTDVASPIAGTNAAGGVIDLRARRPDATSQRELLFSQSLQGATDGSIWLASPQKGSWSRTTFVSAHYQKERDGDDDGWSDLPGYSRVHGRQRVYWNNGKGKIASGTGAAMFEKREGGSDLQRHSLESRGADGALWGQMPLGKYTLAGAASLYVQSRTRQIGDVRERERRQAATMELELRGTAARHRWVAGIVTDWFAIRSADRVESLYLSTRPGIFAHDDMQLAPWLIVSGSARIDHHNIHGFFFSPRGSALARFGSLSARVTAARGFYEPTASIEQTEAAGFTPLTVIRPLERETAHSMSADLSYTAANSDVTFTIFRSQINDPALIDRDTFTLYTDANPIKTDGAEVRGTMRFAPFSVGAVWSHVRAKERGGLNVPLTPRNSASIVVAAERGATRVRGEVVFTGTQSLAANPYRSASEKYTLLNLLAEYRVGRWRVFGSAANLTDVRQTDWDPIARPAPGVDGRWTVDAWAPLGGRLINIGLRTSF